MPLLSSGLDMVVDGNVVISVDAELGWGFHDLADPPMHRIQSARDGWRTLLSLFEQFEIPATWAVVGHLFLDECRGWHEDHPAPNFWFESERTGVLSQRDVRCGPTLIQSVLESPVDHEIGCHTFSHVLFDRAWVTRELVEMELQTSKRAACQFDLDFESFIFPRNMVGYRDLLADYGFTVYRGPGREATGVSGTASKLADIVAPSRVPLSRPYVDEHGLVNVPPSLFLFGFEGLPRRLVDTVWTDPIVRQARSAIDRALESDGLVHLWLHPNNIVREPDIDRLRAILSYVDRQRSRGLSVLTMAEVANRVQVTSSESGCQSGTQSARHPIEQNG